ncbi:hypothetical protein LTR08_004939 [Meristemomyces frigidus]|nr:hypothetical protein LTR08_004939 [Meristemomyces frigidus]
MNPANLQQSDDLSQDFEKKLGLRTATAESAAVSRASSMRSPQDGQGSSSGGDLVPDDVPDEIEGVKPHLPGVHDQPGVSETGTLQHRGDETGGDGSIKHLSTTVLPNGELELAVDGRPV